MGESLSLRQQVEGALLGAVLGDAFGLPHEGATREWLSREPVQRLAGGGPHGQPPGTWSDDSSLLLSLADALCSGYDPNRIGAAFLQWWREGRWTPYGRVFGYGATTAASMERMKAGVKPTSAGLASEGSNGNGSLMRTLPVALYFSTKRRTMLEAAHEVSSITHAHPRSLICCGIYCLLVSYVLEGANREDAVESAVRFARSYYTGDPWRDELGHLDAVLSLGVANLDRYQVRSGGYVVETLEAAIWTFLRARDYPNALKIGVNLGGDTDTVGCVVGGLAGTLRGRDGIPEEWLAELARLDAIEQLCDRFYNVVEGRR